MNDTGRPRAEATTEPRRTRDQLRDYLAAADRYLAEQPTGRTVRAAGRRLHAGLTDLVEDIAGRKPC